MSTPSSTTVIGVDGAGPGWVAAVLDQRRLLYVIDLGELPPAAVIAVDIPLRFPTGAGPRPAEQAARKLLKGSRRSSVFPTAPLPVYELDPPGLSYDERYAKARETMQKLADGASISPYSYGLRDKILQAQQAKADGLHLIEVHPEVVFATLAGGTLTSRKATWDGQQERAELLKGVGLNPHDFAGEADEAKPDDVLDAIAAAWVAMKHEKGTAQPLGEPVDASDLPIWT